MSIGIALSRHPFYQHSAPDFELWRSCYAADEDFLEEHLKQFSLREDGEDFHCRKNVTPIPSFAKSAIDDIKNAVFQRLADVSRSGGSDGYQKAIMGEDRGVDRRGNSMNAFIGQEVITELLVMQQVGIYVDNSPIRSSVPLTQSPSPFIYRYRREDILNWVEAPKDHPSQYLSLLLQDTQLQYDETTRLPHAMVCQKRLLWIDEITGKVNLRIMNDKDEDLQEPQVLELNRIPFVLLDINDSLMRPICRHQIALLNLTSSDVWYALKSNFPFYVEQRDLRSSGSHLKPASTDGTAMSGGQAANDTDIKVGITTGRAYGQGLEQPNFINPSSEPLEASLKLQDKLERDIRRLVNLAVTQLGQQSAESKDRDNNGLEAGLSFIGLVLESAERKIASHWAAYEEKIESRRAIATIKYPDRYSLKTDADRIEESSELSKLVFTIPGETAKKEIHKLVAHTLLSGKVDVETLTKIDKEIDSAEHLTSDPDTIIEAQQAGLVGERVASMALGFKDGEYLQAREDHAARAKRVAEAQASIKGNMGARGVDDLSDDPKGQAAAEKETSRSRDLSDSTAPRVRGDADGD